jgi:phenylacetate-CoA ligase
MGDLVGWRCRGQAMNERLLQAYHHAPYPLKVLAASAWGYYLRRWRYGPETEQFVREALQRETWAPEKWRTWQEDRLALVLHRAATRVPYYREQWAQRRRQGDLASWEYLENWPILEKEPLRLNPKAFLADDCPMKKMYLDGTSGSTGTPLDLWLSCETVRHWYALSEARWRMWHGVSRHDRWAILGGKLVTSVAQRRPPFWVWNGALNQLYLSSYHLAPNLVHHYLDALQRHRIKYLWGYTSSLYALAQEVLDTGRRDLQMQVVITNAEPIFSYQRRAIAEAFQCPVRETYGMAEVVAAASECEAGRLHLWPEAGIVEVLEGNKPVRVGESGDLVCTGLLNADMPLIRYRVGDRGTLPKMKAYCSCGRTLPVLDSIDGRDDDVLYTPDGRSIGRLDPVFKTQLPIKEAQIIQETLNRIIVRFIPGPGFSATAGQAIIERLQAHMGPIEVSLQQVAKIPRGPNGKFQAVISKMKPSQTRQISQK